MSVARRGHKKSDSIYASRLPVPSIRRQNMPFREQEFESGSITANRHRKPDQLLGIGH